MSSSRAALTLALLLVASSGARAEGYKQIAAQDGIVVEVKPGPEGATWVRGRGELDVPFEALRSAFLSLERFPTWMPSLTAWTVIEKDDAHALVYGRHKLPWPMADRDYLVRYTWTESPGRLVLSAVSARPPKKFAPVNGVVRLNAVRSTWTLEARGDKTRVTYRYNGELGGSVPRWAAESGWKSEAPTLFRAIERDVKAP